MRRNIFLFICISFFMLISCGIPNYAPFGNDSFRFHSTPAGDNGYDVNFYDMKQCEMTTGPSVLLMYEVIDSNELPGTNISRLQTEFNKLYNNVPNCRPVTMKEDRSVCVYKSGEDKEVKLYPFIAGGEMYTADKYHVRCGDRSRDSFKFTVTVEDGKLYLNRGENSILQNSDVKSELKRADFRSFEPGTTINIYAALGVTDWPYTNAYTSALQYIGHVKIK